jgi:hypothetical protein
MRLKVFKRRISVEALPAPRTAAITEDRFRFVNTSATTVSLFQQSRQVVAF